MEDWEFWVRAAAAGVWGNDLPEYLIWDRRKPPQAYTSYRWQYRDDPQAIPRLRDELRTRYPQLFRDGPPRLPNPTNDRYPRIAEPLPFQNRLAAQGKRRILMLLPSIAPGGADRYALDLAAGLTAGGDRVSVCLTRDMAHGWLPDLEQITSDVFNLPAFLAPGDIPRFLHYLIESRSITHVFISNSLLGYNLLAYLRSCCPHVAYLDFVHAEQEQRHGGFARVAGDHDQLLDLHAVTSQHLGTFAAGLGVDPQRTEICYIGTDDQHWRPDPAARLRVRAELGIPAEQTLILFVARLSAEKRPRLAAQILLALRKTGAPFAALIVGDGEDQSFMNLFLGQNRMQPQVRMLGNQPHSRVRELMAAADILLLPSQREGIALTLYEAMATGVVPVAAQVGGHAELVIPSCGILIAHGPHEQEQYVAALRQLIEQPDRRRNMGVAARIRIGESFSATVGLARIQAAFDRATQFSETQPRLPVSPAVGLASATLAIEHEQLDRQLRQFAPVRIALALRWSSAGRVLTRLAGWRSALFRLDRGIYTTRRTIGQFIRRIRKRK
jgi:glycosyltransferase involved in cell wall biosynthesis